MTEINLIPIKYRKVPYTGNNKLYKEVLKSKFKNNSKKILNYFLSRYNNLKNDSSVLSEDFLFEDNNDKVYSQYGIISPENKKIKELIYNLDCIVDIKLIFSVKFLIDNYIGISSLTFKNLKIISDSLNVALENINICKKICTKKGLLDVLCYIENHSQLTTKSLEVYYNSIS